MLRARAAEARVAEAVVDRAQGGSARQEAFRKITAEARGVTKLDSGGDAGGCVVLGVCHGLSPSIRARFPAAHVVHIGAFTDTGNTFVGNFPIIFA